MAKLLEAVRNSPVIKRRLGGYSVMLSETKDPFVQGINFRAHFVGSCEVESKQDSPDVQKKLQETWDASQKAGKTLPKVVITVKATNLRVKDCASKTTEDYPIYLVSYCGASAEHYHLFFFIHKTKIDKALCMEIFKFPDASKVTACTLTVAKAFNIAFKAWMAEKRRKEREQNRPGSESPLIQRRQLGADHLAKIAPGVTKTSGPYTPPVVRKTEESKTQVKRRGSFGDSPGEGASLNPAVMRIRTENEATGSTHDVTLTDDFDKEFQALAISRVSPEVLETNPPAQPERFNLEAIKDHIDLGSMEDLTAEEESD